MAIIRKKTFSFDMPSVASVADVVSYNIYYVKDGAVDPATSPKVNLAAVSGQTSYSVILPDQVPVTDGMYQIGVTAVDTEGNESDVARLDHPFDFVAPVAPSNLRVT